MDKTKRDHVRNQVIQKEGGEGGGEREGERGEGEREGERGRGRGEESMDDINNPTLDQPSLIFLFWISENYCHSSKISKHSLLSNYKNSTETENHNSYISIPLRQFF